MPLMTNAEAFLYDFGIYATELWTMTEEQFLTWLNSQCDRERPREMVVRCRDCRFGLEMSGNIECFVDRNAPTEYHGYEWFCPLGERKDDV